MGSIVATVLGSGEGVSLAITFDPAVTNVRVQRQDPSAFPVTIRSGEAMELTAGLRTAFDLEAPLDTEVYYTAEQVAPPGGETAQSNVVTVASFGFSFLVHPGKPTLSCRLGSVQSVNVLNRKARLGLFDVLGRPTPVAVTDVRSTAAGTLILTTRTANEAQAIRNVTADGSVLLLQTPGEADLGNLYIALADVTEERISPAYMIHDRRFTIPFTVVDRPFGLAVAAEGYRWLDVYNTYADWQVFYEALNTWAEVLNQPTGELGAVNRRRWLFPGRLPVHDLAT